MNPAKIIDIRGRRLGGEMALICSPLVGRTCDRLLAEAANVVAKKPDVIEWRVDYFEAIGDTAAVLDAGRGLRTAAGDIPIIFTRRSIKEGGEPIPLDDEGVVRLYDGVGASGLVDFLDFEMGNEPEHLRRVRDGAREHNVRSIFSYHNFAYTPGQEFLIQRFLEAERLGADVAKVAVMPRDEMDVLTLLAATARADRNRESPHQHVDGPARGGDADDRWHVRLVVNLCGRRGKLRARPDPDRRSCHCQRRDSPLARTLLSRGRDHIHDRPSTRPVSLVCCG